MYILVESGIRLRIDYEAVTQLDRILQEYKLPYDTRSIINSTNSNLLRDGRDSISSSRLRQAKLQILFEHLGASRIVEQERQKRL